MKTLSRESLLLWIPVVGALITYLLASPPPMEWSYYEWLKFVAAVLSTASAKFMVSPLPGKKEADKIDITAERLKEQQREEK